MEVVPPVNPCSTVSSTTVNEHGKWQILLYFLHTIVERAGANMIMLIESISVMKIKTKELLCTGLHDYVCRIHLLIEPPGFGFFASVTVVFCYGGLVGGFFATVGVSGVLRGHYKRAEPSQGKKSRHFPCNHSTKAR